MDSTSTSAGRGRFGRIGFILAAAGSAVGLGNIWKFPYVTFDNGGGSFVLIYLAAVLLIGAPIMAAEIVVGRRTQKSPVGAFLRLGQDRPGGKAWAAIGWLGIAAGFVILSYYSVVAGWTIYYFGKCLGWSVGGFTAAEADTLGAQFGTFLGNGWLQIFFHAMFMGATMAVISLGVGGGIERVTKVLMPVLVAILLLLVGNAALSPGFWEAIRFLFHIGPVSADCVLAAVGQAFFSLSLGMGAMITYGSYLSRKDSIPKATLTVCGVDTLIALLASVVMFTIIFAVPADERAATFTKSAVILFTTLPRMFYDMPGGAFLSPVFYLLVGMAALTSTISLLEVVVAYFIDERGWARRKATLVVGTLIFLTGVPAALSLGANPTLSGLSVLGERASGVFATMDYLAANWMLPLGGLLMAIFVGGVLPGVAVREEMELGHGPFGWGHRVWRLLLAVVCPLAVLWILYAVVGGRSFV